MILFPLEPTDTTKSSQMVYNECSFQRHGNAYAYMDGQESKN